MSETKKIRLVEIIQLKKSKELSDLCHKSKNLYNKGLWYINNYYDIFGEYLNWYDLKWMLKDKKEFKDLPSQISQEVLKKLHENYKSFFNNKKNLNKKIPKYLKKNGEFIIEFNWRWINKKNQLERNKIKRYINFPKKILKPIETISFLDEIRCVRIVPKYDIYNLEIVYEANKFDLNLDKERMIAIDIGVNNIACVVNNIGLQPFTFDKRIKSFNHFYNREIAKSQSKISKENKNKYKKEFKGKIYKKNGKETQKFIDYVNWRTKKDLQSTKKMKKLSRIRHDKINDFINNISIYIVKYCIENNTGTIIIGKNPLWKNKVNLGKRNNQNFVQIPFNILIWKLQYKAERAGINVIIITEEYTSKCSFLDNELIKKHEKYKGKRISRGLFKASTGTIINADVNASYNIMKKAFPKAINADGIKGAQLHPLRINLNTKSKLIGIKT